MRRAEVHRSVERRYPRMELNAHPPIESGGSVYLQRVEGTSSESVWRPLESEVAPAKRVR